MAEAFHPETTIHAVADGKSEGGPIQILFDAVEGDPAPGLTGVIGPIDVNSTTPTAKALLSNWSGADYTDQFTLLKTDGSWKLLSKVYHDRNSGRGFWAGDTGAPRLAPSLPRSRDWPDMSLVHVCSDRHEPAIGFSPGRGWSVRRGAAGRAS